MTSVATQTATIDLASASSSIPVHKAHQKQFAFIRQGYQYAFTVPLQGTINSPALSHSLVHRDLSSSRYTLAHGIDEIMLMGPSEQEVETPLRLVSNTFMCQRVRNKLDQSSRAFQGSEILKGLVVEQVKISILR